MTLLEETLGALESRLEKNPVFHIHREEGYTFDAVFEFFKGATEKEIIELETALNVPLPADYKEFLLRHNGAQLFIDTTGYGGCTFELLSISEVIEYCSYMDYPEGWFGIAYGFDGGILVVNTNEIKNNKRNSNYLYWLDCCPVELADKLNVNFEEFLDRFIVCQGTDYWKWYS